MIQGRSDWCSRAALGTVGLLVMLACCQADDSQSSVAGQAPSYDEPRLGMLPTDRTYRAETTPFSSDITPARPLGTSSASPFEGVDTNDWFELAKLLRPMGDVAVEFQPESNGFSISSYDLSAKMPTMPIFGPIPPFLTTGFSFTDIDAPAAADLPSELYDISLGFALVRPINDRWTLRVGFSPTFASDTLNNSSDAWQFRGGLFGMWTCSEQWEFAFGAIATGRKDLPAFPVIGAIWRPRPDVRIDIKLPQPRIAWSFAELDGRQHWLYLGGGFSGGTWAYQRMSGVDDVLTYREWRLLLGWESTPPRIPGVLRPTGLKYGAEVGYVFGREFEFESSRPDLDIDSTVLLRGFCSF